MRCERLLPVAPDFLGGSRGHTTVGNTVHIPRSPTVLAVAQASGLSSHHHSRMCYSTICAFHLKIVTCVLEVHCLLNRVRTLWTLNILFACSLLGSRRGPPSDSELFLFFFPDCVNSLVCGLVSKSCLADVHPGSFLLLLFVFAFAVISVYQTTHWWTNRQVPLQGGAQGGSSHPGLRAESLSSSHSFPLKSGSSSLLLLVKPPWLSPHLPVWLLELQ